MTNKEKINKVCEMLKELDKWNAYEDEEIDKLYRAILVNYCVVKELIKQEKEATLKGEDK